MDFLTKVKDKFSEEDALLITNALDFATKCHGNQKRRSGELYITHPIAVAEILLDLGLDVDTIIAGLLHDVIEDTGVTEEDIKTKFGAAIATMVVAVTKLTNLNVTATDIDTEREIEQAETIRKLFLAMAKDIRVLMVKLADRLHNMRTLDAMPASTQLRKSRETLDIYAPLAGRLGISNIKIELEDLSMKYLYPEEYKFLSDKLNSQLVNRIKLVEKVANQLKQELDELHIQYEIKGRPKHYYSIFKKMRNQNKTLDEIYDLVAVRVIVNTVNDCYTVLGLVHSFWKPVPGRFKDYIASPKPNMYQSLHTTIVTNFGEIFEIQIRTFEMNKIAEYGIAAHWKYKEGISSKTMSDLDKKLGWIKEMMDVEGELKDSLQFLDALKMNVSTDEIFIFTPKGTVVDLPVGSTAIDFAYRIHSEVGNHCVGVKVNGKMTTLDTVLETGDEVQVLTNSASNGPSRDWLKIIKTPTARAKIKAYFKKANKEENIKLGKEMLEEEAKRKGYVLSDLMLTSSLKILFERYNMDEVDELYSSIGCNVIKVQQVLAKLIELYKKTTTKVENTAINITTDSTRTKKIHSNVLINDTDDDYLITIAHCCNPIPGDDILGYVTSTRGVTIHKKTCPNIGNLNPDRILSAKWLNKQENSRFYAPIYLETDPDKNYQILGIISNILPKLNVKMSSFSAKETKEQNIMKVQITLEIKNIDDLDSIIKRFSQIDGVLKVERDK